MAASEDRPYRVAVNGLPHFCQKLTALLHSGSWDVPYRSPFRLAGLAARFNDLRRCDLAYSWTGRITMGKFLRTARGLGKSKIVMLWCGSDALHAKNEFAQGKIDPWVAEKIHWAVSPWLAEEVRTFGIMCEHVQASFVEPVTQPKPIPGEFSVLVYLSSVAKAQLYGLDLMLEAARKLPAVRFKLVGLSEGVVSNAPRNLEIHGRVDLKEFYQESSVLWRPVRHDGLSFMVLEALAQGRHVLYSYPLPGCIQVNNVSEACAEIERLRELHDRKELKLNQDGLDVIARDYSAAKVRENILSRWERIILAPEGARRALTGASV